MDNYIELNRAFEMPDDDNGSYDSYFESLDLLGKKSWDDLLTLPRVVIHARAGFGKSYEMEHMAETLFQQGKSAFYIKLEDLKDERLVEYLLGKERQRFYRWKESESEQAWLFLDSVDELKLTDTKLTKALRNVARDIPEEKLSDIHIYLSSRPSDWSNQVEQPVFEQWLPYQKKRTEEAESLHGEALYLAVLSSDWQGEPVNKQSDSQKIHYFNLKPLTRVQVQTYIEAKLLDRSQAFIRALTEKHAWDFAGCPLDLDGLVSTWTKRGKLGNRLEQYRDGCNERLSKNTLGRSEPRILSTEKALIGAEKVALAMVLTKFSLLLSSESDTDNAPDALSAQDVLSDWTEPEVKELLRSALFDPSTHGCVQFHHRSMREYLTASCLKKLLGEGLSFYSLKTELFKQKYGEQVIANSLKPVVAWLSVMDERFFDLAVEQFPELLIRDGAPDAYRVDQRKCLITAFAQKYSTSEVVVNISPEFAARLAHPELADTLQALWAKHSESPDFRGLALELIEAGRIKANTDIAYAVIQDRSLPSTYITRAIYALEACEAYKELNQLAQQIVETPDQFANSVVINALSVFFPRYITSGQLMALVKAKGVSKRDSSAHINLMMAFNDLANTIAPLEKVGSEFRAALSGFLFDTLDRDSCSWNPSSPYDYLASALKIICYKQLTRGGKVDDAFLLDCVLINKLHEERNSSKYLKVDGMPANSISLDLSNYRKEMFRAELAFTKIFKERDEAWNVFSDLRHSNSLIYPFSSDDWNWLVELLESDLDLFERQVATWMLHSVWLERGSIEQEKETLKSYSTQADLEQKMFFLFKPITEDLREKQWKEEDEANAKKIAEQDRHQQQNNVTWRADLLAQPTQELEKEVNLIRLYDWMSRYKNDYSYIAWDKVVLASAFSSEVADAAEQAFCQIWREHQHTFWSERDKDIYFSLPDLTRLVLNGVYVESQFAHWPSYQTEAQVEMAVRLMLVELESFKAALSDLHKSHPQQVSKLIAQEVIAQLGFISERADLPLINELYQLPDSMVSGISTEMLQWMEHFINLSGEVHTGDKVRDVFRFLNRSTESGQLDKATALSCQWLDKSSPISLELALFESLLSLDPKKALQALIPRLKAYQTSEPKKALGLLGELFGHHGFEFKHEFLPEVVEELTELVSLSYQLIAPSEDITHIGMHTPDYRDNAQTARSFLLSSLISTSGSEAHKAILKLLKKPAFKHIQQRMKLWATSRATTDTEEKTFSLNEVKASFIAKDFVPYDRDSLFEAMFGKLLEVEDYLKNDDYSNISNWLLAGEEKDIQKLLSDRLKERKNGLFSLEREPEVFDQKEPDIRLTAPNTNDKAVIEIKHGDKGWSVKDLEEALERQIVGQYLRADNCRAGVLLITFHGINRQYWQLNGKVNFSELINHLKRKAKDLEEMHGYVFRLGVFGLDLTKS